MRPLRALAAVFQVSAILAIAWKQNWTYTTAKFETTGFSHANFDERAFDSKLNQYGSQGWELVSVFDTNANDGGSRFVFAVFKRPA